MFIEQLGFKLSPLWGDSILRMLGERIATSLTLLAMTMIFDTFRTDFSAISYQISMSFRAGAHTGVGIRFPQYVVLHRP